MDFLHIPTINDCLRLRVHCRAKAETAGWSGHIRLPHGVSGQPVVRWASKGNVELKACVQYFLALFDRTFRNSPNKLCLFWEQICLWPASELMVVFLVSDPEQSSVLSCYEQLSSVLELTMAFATHDHSSGTNTSDTSDNPVADIQEVVWTPVKNVLSVHNLLILNCYQNAGTACGRRPEVCFCCSFADNIR